MISYRSVQFSSGYYSLVESSSELQNNGSAENEIGNAAATSAAAAAVDIAI